jgi:hypothetical protein
MPQTLRQIIDAVRKYQINPQDPEGISLYEARDLLQSAAGYDPGPGRKVAETNAEAIGLLMSGYPLARPDAGPGEPLNFVTVGIIDGEVYQRLEQGLGPPDPIQEYEGLSQRETALRELEELEPGRRRVWDEYVGRQLSPGATPWLRSGLEQRFSPLNVAFGAEGALGLNPMAVGGEGEELGRGQTFQDFVNLRARGGVPTPQYLRQLATTAATGLGQTGQPGTAEAPYFRDTQRQFDLGLAATIGRVPDFLQASFAREAGRRFQDWTTRNPGQAWLPQFVEKGFRFGR